MSILISRNSSDKLTPESTLIPASEPHELKADLIRLKEFFDEFTKR